MLAESSSRMKSDQDAILARVNKIRPVKMTAMGLVGSDDGDRGWVLPARHRPPVLDTRGKSDRRSVRSRGRGKCALHRGANTEHVSPGVFHCKGAGQNGLRQIN